MFIVLKYSYLVLLQETSDCFYPTASVIFKPQ